MTTIINTEALPDGSRIAGVVVEVAIFGPTPAAMSSGTGSVIGTASTTSDSSGNWSIGLTPNQSIVPVGTCYVFTRTYPPTTGSPGIKTIEYGIVPPNTVPVEFTTIIVTSPTAVPFSDSELGYHLGASDPHPQYLTQAEGDTRYAAYGSSGGGSLPSSEPHTFISDWDTALGAKSLSAFATPTGNLPMGSNKITGLAPGTASTDAATVGQLGTGSSTSSPNVTNKSANYTAAYGDFVVMDSSGGTRVVTLPTPVAGVGMIYVEQSGSNTVNVSGNIKGTSSTVSVGGNGIVVCFVPSASTWRIGPAYYPIGMLARLDQDNDFGGHVLKDYTDDQLSYSAATATVGSDIPWGSSRQLLNSGGCTVTLPATAPAKGAWVLLGQGSTTQATIQAASGGYIVGTGGRTSPIHTFDQNSVVLLRCIDATAGASGYVASGGMA